MDDIHAHYLIATTVDASSDVKAKMFAKFKTLFNALNATPSAAIFINLSSTLYYY